MKVVNPKLRNQHQKKQASKLRQAARYSGIAFEMLFVMLAGVFGGIKLDEKLNTPPIFTVLLSLISISAAIYLAIKDFLRKK